MEQVWLWLQEIKDPKKKIEICRFVVTTYEKVLTNLRTAMKKGVFNHQEFVNEIKIIDEMVIDLCLNFENYEEDYNKIIK